MADEQAPEAPKKKKKVYTPGSRKGRVAVPGPQYPPDTPLDEDGLPVAGAEVPREWAQRNGYDARASRLQQQTRNVRTAKAAGMTVSYDIDDPLQKFETVRHDHPTARITVRQVSPVKNDLVPGTTMTLCRSWEDLVRHCAKHWTGGEAMYQCDVIVSGKGTVAIVRVELSGEKPADEPAPTPQPQPTPQPAAAQAQPPAGQVWNGYQWVAAAPPQPPLGQVWDGYRWVPAPVHVQQQQAPPPPPPTPPTPAPGDTPATMELKFQLMLKEHELKQREWELTHRPPPQPAPVYQPPPPAAPQETPLQVSLRDPAFFKWYYTQGPGAAQLGLQPQPAPAAAPEPAKKPLDPIEETERAFQHHARVTKLVKGLTEQIAPAPPAPPPPPPPDPASRVKLHNLGPINMLEIDGRVQDSTTGVLLANYDKAKGELDGLIEKVGKKVESVLDKRREATEAEAAARREEAKLADEAREKNERHAQKMREETEALARAEAARVQLRQMAEAKPAPAEDLGVLKVRAPEPNGPAASVAEPIVVTEPEEPQAEPTTN